MKLLLFITLAAVVFAVCVVLVERLYNQDEAERMARRWDERERLLDGRKPVATRQDILQRRSRGRRG